jgi:long-chain acyl-CoA synthetase
MLHNNQNPYTVGLIVPNKDQISRWAKINNKDLNTDNDLAEVLQMISDDLNVYKTGASKDLFPQRWLPSTAVILPESFTEHNKMLNSTMKVVRNKVEEHFNSEIEFLYTPDSKKFINDRNITNLKTFLEK